MPIGTNAAPLTVTTISDHSSNAVSVTYHSHDRSRESIPHGLYICTRDIFPAKTNDPTFLLAQPLSKQPFTVEEFDKMSISPNSSISTLGTEWSLPSLPPLDNDELTQLRDFLQSKTAATILRHCLGIELMNDVPPLMDKAIVNCIDCESYEFNHDKLTEIGLSAFSISDMRGVPAGAYGENFLKLVYYYHHRLISNAHLINTHFCPGDPTKNRFGLSRFVTVAEAKKAMIEGFNWPINPNNPELGNCPVIFLGHALRNDERMLKDALGIEGTIFGAVVKTIDTQHMAVDAGLERYGRQISLANLCYAHGFNFRHSHTAGNDAAYTLFNAVFMATKANFFDNNYENAVTKTVEDVIKEVEQHSQSGYDTIGLGMYCERCGRRNHLRKNCRARVQCRSCKVEGRIKASYSHMTENCNRRQGRVARFTPNHREKYVASINGAHLKVG